jgi:hypothetical protein
MKDYFLLKDEPVIIELEKRLSPVLRKLVRSKYSYKSLYEAQEKLLEEIFAIEESIRLARKEYSEIRKTTNELAIELKSKNGELPKKYRSGIKLQHEKTEKIAFAIELLRYGHWFIRYVADGIAWHAYGFNRMQIRALGGKEPISFLSDKDGFEFEYARFKEIRDIGDDWLPIFHDLTNCLRTGDISVFWNSNLIDVVDVKPDGVISVHSDRDNYSGRAKRQKQRLNRLWKYFGTRDLSDLDPELFGKAIHTKAIEKYNFDAISKAIRKARKNGCGFVEPEPSLLYLAWHLDISDETEALKKAGESHPHIFKSIFTFRAIQPRYDEYHLSLPITAMDLPAKDIIDLTFGKIAVLTFLNFELFEKQCEYYGLPLQVEKTNDGFNLVVSEPYPGKVQDGLWNRLMLEGLSIGSFCSLIKSIYEYIDL